MTNKVLLQSVKRTVKRGLQQIAARFGRHTRSSSDPQLLILMYHRILPIDDPRSLSEEPGMIVTPETFRVHLEIIKEYFKTIHLSQWIDAKHSVNNLHGNYCAVTFDDGWADNYEFAYPILQELKVPATIFPVSEMIGTTQSFWPERLAQLVVTIAEKHPELWSNSALSWICELPISYGFDELRPTREQLSEIIASAKVLQDQEIHRQLDHIEQVLDLDTSECEPALLNWEQINEMVASGIVEIGSHTCRHIRLNDQIPQDLLEREIKMSKQQIENRTNQPVKHFCFPNGDYTTEALALVQSHYAGAVTTETGWNSIDSNFYQLKRIGVHEDISRDRAAFLARISGWM